MIDRFFRQRGPLDLSRGRPRNFLHNFYQVYHILPPLPCPLVRTPLTMSTMPFTLVKTVWLHWPFNMVLIWTEVRDDPCCCPMLQPKPLGPTHSSCFSSSLCQDGGTTIQTESKNLSMRFRQRSTFNWNTMPKKKIAKTTGTWRWSTQKEKWWPTVTICSTTETTVVVKMRWRQWLLLSWTCTVAKTKFQIRHKTEQTWNMHTSVLFFGCTHRLYSTGKFSKKMTLCV